MQFLRSSGAATLWFSVIKALVMLVHCFSPEAEYCCMVVEELVKRLPCCIVSSKGWLPYPPPSLWTNQDTGSIDMYARKTNCFQYVTEIWFYWSVLTVPLDCVKCISLHYKMKMDTEGNSSQLFWFIIVTAVISTRKYLQMKKQKLWYANQSRNHTHIAIYLPAV